MSKNQKVQPQINRSLEMLTEMFPRQVYLSVDDTAEVLGVAAKTLYNQSTTAARMKPNVKGAFKTLPLKKRGKHRVIHKLDLAAWLEEDRRKAWEASRPTPPVRRGRPRKADQIVEQRRLAAQGVVA